MRASVAIKRSRRMIGRSGARTQIVLSREIDTLSDPRPDKGEPVPIEASGSHDSGVTTLTIQPQTGWIFRGAVESGTAVAITGHSTSYATTVRAEVDHTSPDTLALTITPGLEGALSGGEVVTLDEVKAVTYEDTYKRGATQAARRGWATPAGSEIYFVIHSGLRAPQPGDIMTSPRAATVLQVDRQAFDYSTVQVGAVS